MEVLHRFYLGDVVVREQRVRKAGGGCWCVRGQVIAWDGEANGERIYGGRGWKGEEA